MNAVIADVPAGSKSPPIHSVDALLRDGSTVTIRPITPDDAERHVRFFERVDPESKRLRFFTAHPHLSREEVEFFTNVDGVDRVALIALRNDETIAVGRFDRVDAHSAEVAFLVSDAVQGLGIGSLLLDRLVLAAISLGYLRFTAHCLSENRQMLDVFRHSGLSVVVEPQGGETLVELYLVDTARWHAAAERRDASSVVRSVSSILNPDGIAVIGAGRSPDSIGGLVIRNLIASGYKRNIFPVNPNAGEIAGLPALASIDACTPAPDLAIIAVPARSVLDVVEQCGHAGVQGVVIISSGFAEAGTAGNDLQREIIHRAHDFGVRVVGPNCMGVINTAAGMNATFASTAPVAGDIGFASQSGAVGIAVLERAAATEIGLSSFVSLGNTSDVTANDLLRYWESDRATKVGLLYLESLGNPRAFVRIAGKVSQTMPLVALKSGRSPAGQRAAASHTAAAAAADTGVDALFARSGVVRVQTLAELLETAKLFSLAPLPAGDRVAVVSNAGGAAILAADACSGTRLRIAELPGAVTDELAAAGAASAVNPVDLGAGVTAAKLAQSVELVAGAASVDAVVAIVAPVANASPEDVLDALGPVAERSGKPVAVVVLGSAGVMRGRERGLAVFAFPEDAVAALARTAEYASWRRHPRHRRVAPGGLKLEKAHAVVESELSRGRPGWLAPRQTDALLDAYGIATVASATVSSSAEATRAAASLGYPVVLKGIGRNLVHKTDRNAVCLNIGSARRLEKAVRDIRRDLGGDLDEMLVQKMVTQPSVEVIVGGLNDPVFGPLVMVGVGGVYSGLIDSHAFAVAPLSAEECEEMIDATSVAELLRGYRGRAAASRAALAGIIWRIGELLADRPEIAELDCNPVLVGADGAVVVDARIRVADQAEIDDLLRRLA
jgi:acyl-CoA synthetase (NDP forming)/GNAT superfamily N-acetyltransferase